MGVANPQGFSREMTYVPDMKYAADAMHEGPFFVDLGVPAAASGNNILNLQSIATAGRQTVLLRYDVGADCKYGRALSVVASGAATSGVTVAGRDYLGQPMKETFTLTGAVAVLGKKAFKYIDYVDFEATAATTINVGTTSILGVPYKMRGILLRWTDRALLATGTLAYGDDTNPQTATTGDPRGTYLPASVPDGARRYELEYEPDRNNLHGYAHYFA